MDEPIDDLLRQGRDEEVKARIAAMLQQPAQTPMPPEVAAGVLEAIIASDQAENTPVVSMPRRRNWWLIAACAAVVLLALGATYFWFNTPVQPHKENQPAELAGQTIPDVQPGGNRAIITLADGTVIDLDKAANGELASAGGATVRKKEDGRVEFEGAHSPVLSGVEGTTHHSPAFNTVSTPNGGQYQIVLPDGSRVWLNAASSIRFPTSFATERTITMTGEVYFEVAHHANRPFVVNVNDKEEVVVLGTHFNINAYENDQAIHTTLLQGSVKVVNSQWSMANGKTALLKPGEQAVIADNSPLIINHSPDLEQVVAWKNGLFNLAGADLKDLMHQVERWYDVKVMFIGTVPQMEFQGKLNRAVPLSDIIDYLKNLGVECRLENKTLLVKSK